MNSKPTINKAKRFYLILLLLIVGVVDFGMILYAQNSTVAFFIAIGKKKFLMLLFEHVLFFTVLISGRKKQEELRNKIGIKIINVITCCMTPGFIFVAVQIIIGAEEFNVQSSYWVKNLILYYAFFVIFWAVLRKASIAIPVYTMLMVILALVDYYVTLFRGNPFILMDVYNVGTAAEVTSNYIFSIPVKTGICLLAILIFLLYQSLFQSLQLGKRSIKGCLVRVCLFACVSGAVYLNWGTLTFEWLNQWDMVGEYKNKGYIYTLACETQYLQITKPDNYSVEAVEEIAEEVEQKDSVLETSEEEEKVTPQNLIVIMNESLADFEAFDNLQASEEILPTIHSLQENTKKGYLYVPVFGGGTSDSEYEVLTGNSKQFLPYGANAYQVLCRKSEYGLASTLKQEDYSAIAVHPFWAKGWNRTNVYSWMNFDSFVSLDNWDSDVDTLRDYATDDAAYAKLEQLCSEKENEKQFLFCVTMQNHGGYNVTDSYTPDVSLSYATSYPSAEVYLSLAKETDAAFGRLIEYFENVDEPTMIVMFGDHWPNLDTGFFSELFGKDFDSLDWIESQMYHRTPYIIWTNYSSESSQEDMSANFFGSYILEQAGLELTTYNKFLLQLKQTLPVIANGAVCDASGNWYALGSLPDEYQELIEQYQILQYNNVADRKHRIDSVFGIAG